MRTYFIYRQDSKFLEATTTYATYKWLPPEYIGYVVGTKQLAKCLYYNNPYRLKCCQSIQEGTFKREFGNLIFGAFEDTTCWLIIDDKGRYRDYYDLISKYVWRSEHKSWGVGYRKKAVSAKHKKLELSYQDIKEIGEYCGKSFPKSRAKSDMKNFDGYRYSKISNSWKDQSKRKKQYKVVK